MDASKENCRKATALVRDDWGKATATGSKDEVLAFLVTAEKRLPSAAALARDKKRKRIRTK